MCKAVDSNDTPHTPSSPRGTPAFAHDNVALLVKMFHENTNRYTRRRTSRRRRGAGGKRGTRTVQLYTGYTAGYRRGYSCKTTCTLGIPKSPDRDRCPATAHRISQLYICRLYDSSTLTVLRTTVDSQHRRFSASVGNGDLRKSNEQSQIRRRARRGQRCSSRTFMAARATMAVA